MKVEFTTKEIQELKKVSTLVREIANELDLSDDLDTETEFQLKNGTWVTVERSSDGSMCIDLDPDLMGELLSFTSDLVEASRPLWMVVKGLFTMGMKKGKKLTTKVEALCEYGLLETDLQSLGLKPSSTESPSYFYAVVERRKGSNVWTAVRDTEFGLVKDINEAQHVNREILFLANKCGISKRFNSHNTARKEMHKLADKSR